MGVGELLLIATPGAPALLGALWPVSRMRKILVAAAPWAALPALALAILPGAEGATVSASTLFTGLHLTLDTTGRAFLVLTALLWVLAGAFARSYHATDPRRGAFFGFFVLTMAGNMGVVLAGDILSFYLFFAVMTFAAYGLVAHRRDGEARRAGRVYIVMAILGEVALLAGVLALGWAGAGVPEFGSATVEAWSALHEAGWASGAAALLVLGFGVKAGVVPLHLWLPLAHPVAPTAASALLSGVMIEAGVLAWVRFLPSELALPAVGTGLALVGVVSIFYGVAAGLAQDDPKTVLAYSSVSQMGYLAMGTGALLRTEGWATAGLLAVILFALHHGVAKGALFLAVGVADRTPPSPRSRWQHLVPAVAALPALALAGAPLTTGAMAKTTLKSGLRELAPAWYAPLDPVLLGASVGTTLLMARFLIRLRVRMTDRSRHHPNGSGDARADRRQAFAGLLAPWLILVALGVAGPVWLSGVVPSGVDAALPGPWDGAGEAAWPVMAGVLVAGVVWRRPDFLGRIGRLRVPPGDLLIPLEFLAGRLRRLPWGVLEEGRGGGIVRAIHRGQVWVHARAARAAEWDLGMARGTVIGFLLAGLAVALAVALASP
ncbi:MAG TPA: complex I subunit 5 family protein [Longimicrobiales bacterium]|nr:complex I subunit 5 family protein [Longimicrobiales bacterium]